MNRTALRNYASAVANASVVSTVTHQTFPATQGEDEDVLLAARQAQQQWAGTEISSRTCILRALRNEIAEHASELASLIPESTARSKADILVSEVLPLADALRFLEQKAQRLLKPRRLGVGGRPLWLWQVSMRRQYVPHGIVLVIGPGNYPLFLPGVQAMQALAAGNAVLLKPGEGGAQVAKFLAQLAQVAGLPDGLLTILDEPLEAAQEVISKGVDKVVLTGSAASGRALLRQTADHLTPAVLELSGCDAFFVLPNANVQKAVEAVAFGLLFNGGATCIAPRRIFVHNTVAAAFQNALAQRLRHAKPVKLSTTNASVVYELIREALDCGAVLLDASGMPAAATMRPAVLMRTHPQMAIMQADVFAPVASVMIFEKLEDALTASDMCPYALGASVFGALRQAEQFAHRVKAGTIVVNDVIAPTADPRLSFGGSRESGFGKTRGAEGLLEMVVSKTIVVQRAKRPRHLEAPHPRADLLFRSYLQFVHGKGFEKRFTALKTFLSAARKR